jgi:ubiquinone/menaquinone biosynthesis C-methylase UbiE
MPVYGHSFENSAAYEQFMGRWSRAAGVRFIEWLAPPERASWLDAGCGTGVFTRLIAEKCSPARIVAVDSTSSQIARARSQPAAEQITFETTDAQALPFAADSFDIVVSALAINFFSDPGQALIEMRRVTREDGLIAGYVWDFAGENSPSGPLRRALRESGIHIAPIPGTDLSTVPALRTLFERAGLERISTEVVDVSLSYRSFDEFWQAQTTSYSPTTKLIAAMTTKERERFIQKLRARFSHEDIRFAARAHAIKARTPSR